MEIKVNHGSRNRLASANNRTPSAFSSCLAVGRNIKARIELFPPTLFGRAAVPPLRHLRGFCRTKQERLITFLLELRSAGEVGFGLMESSPRRGEHFYPLIRCTSVTFEGPRVARRPALQWLSATSNSVDRLASVGQY